MPKKKTQKNPFYLFMENLQAQYVEQGMKKPSMAEMVGIASPKWEQLSPEEKEKYNAKANRIKNSEKMTLEGKLTADGLSIVEVQKELKEKEQAIIEMKRDVQDIVTNIGGTATCIAEADFLIMTFNILCATDDGIYIPNELGIVKFNLNEGVKEKFHKFIDPGPIPAGYTGDAKAHSEKTHQIPIHAMDFEDFDSNYSGIYQDIKNFVEIKRGETVMVFCKPDHLEQNAACLTWLHEKAWTREKQQIAFADITYLLMELAAAVDQPFSSESLAVDVLNQHSFDYCANTSCKFHEELDNAYCAVATPQRLSYILSDALCPLYNITVTEKHLPPRLSRNVMIETWQPKGPIKPVRNIVNVPLKPVSDPPIMTMIRNDRSVFVDYDDSTIVPSMTACPPVLPRNEPKEQLPDLEDDEEFPSLGRNMRNMQIRNTREEQITLRQPRAMPDVGLGRGNVWQQNMGRGNLISASFASIASTSNFGVSPEVSQLGVGVGRGMRRKT